MSSKEREEVEEEGCHPRGADEWRMKSYEVHDTVIPYIVRSHADHCDPLGLCIVNPDLAQEGAVGQSSSRAQKSWFGK